MPNEIPYGYGANVSPYYTITPGSVNAQGISTPSVVTDTRTWWHRLLGLGRNELAAAQNASLQEQLKYQSDMAAYDEYHNSLPYQVEQYQAAGLNPQLLSGGLGQGSSNAASASQSPENPGVGSGLEDLQGLVSMLSPILSFVGQANEIASANARTQSELAGAKERLLMQLEHNESMSTWLRALQEMDYEDAFNSRLLLREGRFDQSYVSPSYRKYFSTKLNANDIPEVSTMDILKFLNDHEDVSIYDIVTPEIAEQLDYVAGLSMSYHLGRQGYKYDKRENDWRISRQGIEHQMEVLSENAKEAQLNAALKDTTMVTDSKWLQPLRAVMSFIAPLLSVVAGATGRVLSGRRVTPGRPYSRSSERYRYVDTSTGEVF